MNYPLQMRFKIMALAPQIHVTDSTGATVCYVRQKMFRLKENVSVFRDESQKTLLCEIKADRIIDWSASYHFYDTTGATFGGVRRKGMRSIWKACYELMDESNQQFANISEENPMAKIGDALLSEIPVLGILTGYFFHPKYLLKSAAGQPLMRMTKHRAFLEGRFEIEKLGEGDEVDELRALMSFLMMALLERQRG